MFAASELLSHSLSYSAKYKRAWLKAKVIRSYILSTGGCPDACSRALSIAPNNQEIPPIMVCDRRHFPKKYANAITRHEHKEKNCAMQHQVVMHKNKQNTEKIFHIQYCVHCVFSIKERISKLSSRNQVFTSM